MNKIGTLILLLSVCLSCFAQEDDQKEKEKALKSSTNLTWDGNKALSEDNFVAAEADYRKAIAKSADNSAAPYNLGNAYYQNETYNEAFGRFKEAGEASTSKADKHKAYHNMGNVFMKNKDYAKAVEAYKEALRNNPKDEETRYNLALAKELLKKEQDENKQDQDDKDKDQEDQDKDKDQDNKDKGENEDKKDDGDKGDEGDEGDKDEEKKDDNKDGEGDKESDQKKKPEQGEGENEQNQQQPRPNQLSKQQVENLLRAMQNAEKKVQDKIDAKKVKGAKIKNEKDW